MKLFEYAAIYNPLQTQAQKDSGESAKSKLIVPITTVLARDQNEAMMLAARAIPEEYTDKLDRVEIACRPF